MAAEPTPSGRRVGSVDVSSPPGWHPDPAQRHELRWFDGTQWTANVSTRGVTGHDPLPGPPAPVSTPDEVQHQVARAVHDPYAGAPWSKADPGPGAVVPPAAAGGGTLFTEPVLVVNQKAKLIEVTNEYAVFDQHGRQLGAVRQVGQSTARKVIRVMTSWDQFLTHRLEIVDVSGQPVLRVTRPGKVFKSRFQIERGDGQPVGEIVQENVFGKIRFGLHAGGQPVGSVNAENWRAWNFSIRDAAGTEVARITKTWEGFAKAMFTTADNYVVAIHRPLDEPLRSLVVASALSVDTALKQDNQGFN